MEKNLGEAKVGETAESLRATLARMQKSLEALEAGVEDGRLLLRETRDQVSPAREETVALLRELSATSRALRELVGRIDEQPESLIQGKR